MSDRDGQPMTYTCQAVTRNSDFTLPKGTMITLLASLDENNPTYWYYYCTEDKSSIDLSDFKKMNTANMSTTTQSGESVYDTIFTTSSSRVTENMIFVFDFSEVATVEWENLSSMEGHVMLKHTYQGSKYPADIMDYVASESQSDETGISYTYTREMPRQTDSFKISANSDGIEQFTLHNRDGQTTYGQKEQMTYQLNIIPDTSVTNTQYDEREYAVILTLRKKGEQSEIAFPEGTTFTYHGEKLSAGKDNKYVIVPVDTVGSHEVEIASVLYGFDPGEYDLVAKLYSTTQEGYYNSIPVASNASDQTTATFKITKDPVYALKVEEKRADSSKSVNRREKNHFIQAGESFDFAVTANGGEPNDAVTIQAYRYVDEAYHMISMDELFEQTPNLHTGVAQSWQPVVKAGVAKGTYRLAFMYHDKVEYWDFMTIQ